MNLWMMLLAVPTEILGMRFWDIFNGLHASFFSLASQYNPVRANISTAHEW